MKCGLEIGRERERARERVEENRILRLRVAQLGEILADELEDAPRKKLIRSAEEMTFSQAFRACMASGEARRVGRSLPCGCSAQRPPTKRCLPRTCTPRSWRPCRAGSGRSSRPGQGVAVHAHCARGVRGQDHAAAAAGANRPV